MNDAKYIGLDVHQATISAAVLDSTGKLVMEAILETKAGNPSTVCPRSARQLACDLRRRLLRSLVTRFGQAPRASDRTMVDTYNHTACRVRNRTTSSRQRDESAELGKSRILTPTHGLDVRKNFSAPFS